MANVRVDVEAADKASAVIKKVAGEVGGLSKTAAASAGGFGKLVGNVDGMVRSLTGFSLAQVSVAGAVAKGAEMVTEAVSNYSAYVEQIDHMAIRTGMATEEVSRLVQVADDFRVETSTLERAMTLALQNGFEPTTENLAELADRFISIQDPTERAAAMQDIFGKSWADLVPLLERGGDAIREASAGISDSLIVTEDATNANREYIASLDTLQDAWTGVQNEAAKGLIPSMTVFAKDMEMLMEGASLAEVLAFNQEEYRKIEERATSTEKLRAMGLERSAESARLSGMAEYYRKQQLAAGNATTDAATRVTDTYSASLTAQAEAYGHSTRRLWEMNAGLEEYRAMQEQIPALTQNVADAQTNLNTTMQNFSQNYAGDVVGALQAAGVSGEKYEQALAAVDAQNGTNLLGQYEANKALEEAVKQYQKDGDVKKFSTALAANKSEWEQLDDNVQQAKSALEQAKGAFDALMADMASWNGKTFTIQVTTGGTGGRDPGGTGGVTEQVCCFAGYTPIATPEGDRAIDSLNDGDMVLVWTGETTEAAPVVRRYMAERSDTILIGLVDGRILHTTPNHPLLVEGGDYTEAGKLQEGMRIAGTMPGIVLAVALLSGSFQVYDITVSHAAHNFLADGICAHNKPAPDFRTCGSANTSAGRVGGGGGNVTIDIRNITVVTGNAQEFINQLGKLAARGRSAGAGYAGG